ncbi:Lipid-translocating exporter-like protein RTA1 [Fulvia fulva]|nr:Lipid-translocating exporter-like protein RTA1 [Fulvia fulva]WPV33452.1 Lipid-translocating exporter-like protein RTA1 [Fulvia fulva]
MADDTGDWSLYPYDPNKGAPVAFAIIIAVVGIYQIYQSFFLYHWPKFGSTMAWASSVWLAGFICRSISIRSPQNVGVFIAQYVLVLIGPPLYAAAEYFILSRLLSYLPYHTPIHPGRVFSTFVLLSTIVETLTGSGAGNSAGSGRTEAQRSVGLNLLKAALILQCFIEALFFSLVVLVERRCRRAGIFPKRVRTVCCVLYVTSAMIFVRCVVRTVEGFEAGRCEAGREDPYCGPVSRNEWFLWTFEVANITLFVILLSLFHPGRFLPKDNKVFLDPHDGKTERIGPGFSKADSRAFWATVVDPFNLTGILSGKGMVLNKFWEEAQPVYTGDDATAADDQPFVVSQAAKHDQTV